MSELSGLPASLDASLRRRLDTLRSNGAQFHHVADLKTGKLSSDMVFGPPTAATRKQRLKLLGHVFDDLVFGQPAFRMSSRKPYQESPRVWMEVSSAVSYLTEVEHIAWAQPRDPGGNRGFIVFHFDEPPRGECLATFSISAFPWAGSTGHVTLRAGGSSVSVPITGSFNHTIELIFQAPATGPVEVGMIIEPGVQVLAFFWMTLGLAPPVIVADV